MDMKECKPIVAIRCITYNHEPYIRDALEGFVMQKTDFPFVAIVHDDASTDGTAAIIREYAAKYPDIITPIYETENQYSKGDGSIGRIMQEAQNATGAKYIAMCEGDDYWTDPLKLQKQVDFLESHPDYGMCYTQVRRFYQESQELREIFGGPNESFEALIKQNTVPTLTVVMNAELFNEYYTVIQPSQFNWKMGDYPLWLYATSKKKTKFIPEITAVYRVLKNSASHSSDYSKWLEFDLSYRDIQIYFSEQVLGNATNVMPFFYGDKLQIACCRKENSPKSSLRKLLLRSLFKADISSKQRLKYFMLAIAPDFVNSKLSKRR